MNNNNAHTNIESEIKGNITLYVSCLTVIQFVFGCMF